MVKGIANFQKRMRSIPLMVRLEVVKQLEKEAGKLVREMRLLVPVDTGGLSRSIGWTWGDAPKGAVTIGKVANNEYDRIAITIYAGGTAETVRTQNRASGTRARDQKRSGTFSGGNADVAFYQEFGTVNMPANPFFFPAYRANKSRMRAGIKRAVRRGFKKASQ